MTGSSILARWSARVFSFLLLLLVTGCGSQRLSVCSEYLDERYLASFHCDTPDPYLHCFFGEQLIVNWCVPERYIEECGATLHLAIRFRNRTVNRIVVPITRPRDTYIYRIVCDEYCSSGGILTYKAEIVSREGAILDQWCHHIWVEFITFDD